MEQYLVNGVPIEYDTFSLDCIEAYEAQVQRVSQEANAPKGSAETTVEQLQRICGAMRDVFDRLCGEGTARKVFGETTNVKAIYEGYGSFVQQIGETMRDFAEVAPAMFAPAAQE